MLPPYLGGCLMKKGGREFISATMLNNEMIAMILAGGKGTRLGKLTKSIAKPAVPFGGKYRIIDFTLSNCMNSGITTAAVVTQYEPMILNDHIGNGDSCDLYTRDGSPFVLQPYSSIDGEKWFNGTANAIYQNVSFIDSKNPEYVLILSRSEEHTSELQSRFDLVCRLLLEKKKRIDNDNAKRPINRAARKL